MLSWDWVESCLPYLPWDFAHWPLASVINLIPLIISYYICDWHLTTDSMSIQCWWGDICLHNSLWYFPFYSGLWIRRDEIVKVINDPQAISALLCSSNANHDSSNSKHHFTFQDKGDIYPVIDLSVVLGSVENPHLWTLSALRWPFH